MIAKWIDKKVARFSSVSLLPNIYYYVGWKRTVQRRWTGIPSAPVTCIIYVGGKRTVLSRRWTGIPSAPVTCIISQGYDAAPSPGSQRAQLFSKMICIPTYIGEEGDFRQARLISGAQPQTCFGQNFVDPS